MSERELNARRAAMRLPPVCRCGCLVARLPVDAALKMLAELGLEASDGERRELERAQRRQSASCEDNARNHGADTPVNQKTPDTDGTERVL